MFFNLVLRNLAILWDGAGVLFTTGLIGIFSLCIFISAFSLGVLGCMLVRFYKIITYKRSKKTPPTNIKTKCIR